MDIAARKAIAFCMTVIAAYAVVTVLTRSPVSTAPGNDLPVAVGPWAGREVNFDRGLLTSWLGTDRMVFREYTPAAGGAAVTAYVAYYPDMDASDLAHEPEVCYPGQGWAVRSDGTASLDLGGLRAQVKRMVVEKGDEREVVYSWWQTSDGVFAQNWKYRLHMVAKRVMGEETSSIWVRLSARLSGEDPEGADRAIRAFAHDAFPLLRGYFPGNG